MICWMLVFEKKKTKVAVEAQTARRFDFDANHMDRLFMLSNDEKKKWIRLIFVPSNACMLG